MLRRCLTLGLPLGLALLLVFGSLPLPWEAKTAIFTVVVVGISIEIAHRTTQQAAGYGASGMVAGMAAMMAAMGTGLTIGYATGMVWMLGWANLAGVLAGFAHGLVMGRRYGPMAALDGAGGGVMGGLMGPMLGVMLLYQPVSLILTALLMLALQVVFSVGGVYLVAASAGAVGSSGLLYQVGRVLGAHYLTGPLEGACAPSEVPAPLPAPARQPKTPVRARRGPPRGGAQPRRSWLPLLVAGLAGTIAFLVIFGGAGLQRVRSPGSSITRADSFAAAADGEPVAATVGPDGAQQLSMTLTYPRYEPRLMEVKTGIPVRLNVEAIGEPG